MLNGKFFTGLPPGMMNKSSANNRQKTNFFWPNDSDYGTLNDGTKIQKNLSNDNKYVSVTNNTPECEPEKLFKKQLSSSIQFYDDVNKEDYQRPSRNKEKRINNTSTNEPKLNDLIDFKAKSAETFCSKIQFFDFPDDANLSSKTHKKEKNNQNQAENRKLLTNSVKHAGLVSKPIKEDEVVVNRLNNFSNLNLKTKLVNRSTGNIPQVIDKKIDSKAVWNKDIGIDNKNSWKTQKPEAALEKNDNYCALKADIIKKPKNNEQKIKKTEVNENINSSEEIFLYKVPNNIEKQKGNSYSSKYELKMANDKNKNNSQENDSLRHLKSSFSFDANDDITNAERRKIRSRAFTRVTVGLPD